MKDNLVLLICGKARTGKGVFSLNIKDCLEDAGYKVCQIQLMRTLKSYVKDYFGWDGTEETKPREFLQEFGTSIIREKMNMPLFHIERLLSDIKVLSNYFNAFIVDDVRLPIEIEEIKKVYNNVCVIKIERDNYDNGMSNSESMHITETSLDDYDNYDYIIKNDTLEKLKDDSKMIVSEVIKNEIHD